MTTRLLNRLLPLVLVFTLDCGGALAADDEPVFSGPQPGEALPALKVRGVEADLAGKELDIVQRAADKPLVLVFVHERTRPSFAVTNDLMRFVSSRKDLAGCIVYLTDDITETERWLGAVKQHLPTSVVHGISMDGQEGPGAYGLNRNVALTVLVAKDRLVTANFALIQPSVQADLPKIVRAVLDTAGGEMPDLKLLGDRYGQPPEMRPDAPKPFDPRPMLAPLIRKTATPDEVDRGAAAVDAAAEKDPAVRRHIGQLARKIVEAGVLENYGTARAQEHLRRWAKDFQ